MTQSETRHDSTGRDTMRHDLDNYYTMRYDATDAMRYHATVLLEMRGLSHGLMAELGFQPCKVCRDGGLEGVPTGDHLLSLVDEHVDVEALGLSAQLAASLDELIDPDLAGSISVQEGEESLRIGHVQLEGGKVRLWPTGSHLLVLALPVEECIRLAGSRCSLLERPKLKAA